MDDLIAEFLTETNESLAELDLALVKLERTPNDSATLSLIFRLVHTIKGTCGFLGLPRLEHVAHAAENVLGRVRDKELSATTAVVSAVLAALDRIKLIVAGLAATGTEPAGDDTKLVAMLERASRGEAEAGAVAEEAVTGAGTGGVTGTGTVAVDEPPEPAAADPVMGVQTIRVNVDVLEELMTLVGELVLTRNQLLQLARTGGTSAFSVPLQRLSHITTDLQEGVMKTRMQPIGSAWNKLPRLVRDLAHETGKKIALDMHGEATELDRQVLELMRDPLTHMVRNSADHGLEPPDVRRAAGKADTGRIKLNAYHEGGHIIIEVEDDGYGLNVERIRAKALQNGLATEAEIAMMSEAQIKAFIFRAGFSTAAAVTSISGRGVGMDVVRSNIERIGGTVELTSTLGVGTRFTIKIPLTLAIVSALIVRVRGERFAVPQINVLELVRVGISGPEAADSRAPDGNGADGTGDAGQDRAGQKGAGQDGAGMSIEHIGATPVLRLRDQLLPLISLGDALELHQPGVMDGESAAQATVVVTAVGSGMLGIVVDEVYDTEEIVVKPVAPILRHVTMFSGNTILGDGSVVMILDPNGVARSAGVAARAPRRDGAEAGSVTSRSTDGMALLLFRAAGESAPRVVPLSLVARLEAIPRDKIERSASGFLTQYRGRLMPLVPMGDGPMEGSGGDDDTQAVLVFSEGDHSMGLMVDEIVDVVHGSLHIELGSTRPGLLGTAIIAGQAADVLDTSYWLTEASRDWFAGAGQTGAVRRLLIVEDSDFFRHLLVPALAAQGYEVTAASSAGEALRLRDGGLVVDAIVSDIDMPDMDGLAFAREVRAGGAWAALPMIALTGRDGPADAARGRDAGFTDYCRKFERDLLLESLRNCLSEQVAL
jgi:two-component system chemotaxis sensor kinase CheA